MWNEWPQRSRSYEDVDEYLSREQRRIESLSAVWGREVVGKLDGRVLRDVLYERRQQRLDELFASAQPGAEKGRRRARKIRVLVNVRQARRDPAVFAPARDLHERRQVRRDLEISGRLALSRIEDQARQEGVEVEKSLWLSASAVMTLTAEQVQRFAARADVGSVASDKPMPMIRLDTSRPLIQADQVEALGIDGTGVTVGLVDTGVDTTHPALVGVVTGQTDFTGEGNADGVGHGTHCAGIIASQDRRFRGIAPGAQILALKVLDSTGSGTTSNIISGFTAAVTAGVQVVSASLGASHAGGQWNEPFVSGGTDDSCPLCIAVNNGVAAGIVHCIAAGNDDNDSCQTYDTHINCPGNASAAITVGASDDSDMMGDFSSVGPTTQGRQKPDLVAPGVQIASCRATGTSMGSPIDDLWTNSDGTSMATPHVAGVAALMLSKTPTLSPANVKAAMIATVVNIGASPEEMGAGRIDALAAVNAV